MSKVIIKIGKGKSPLAAALWKLPFPPLRPIPSTGLRRRPVTPAFLTAFQNKTGRKDVCGLFYGDADVQFHVKRFTVDFTVEIKTTAVVNFVVRL